MSKERPLGEWLHLFVIQIEGWNYFKHADGNLYYRHPESTDDADWLPLENAFGEIVREKVLHKMLGDEEQ